MRQPGHRRHDAAQAPGADRPAREHCGLRRHCAGLPQLLRHHPHGGGDLFGGVRLYRQKAAALLHQRGQRHGPQRERPAQALPHSSNCPGPCHHRQRGGAVPSRAGRVDAGKFEPPCGASGDAAKKPGHRLHRLCPGFICFSGDRFLLRWCPAPSGRWRSGPQCAA